MALEVRTIAPPKYLSSISGIVCVTQKKGSGAVTVHYNDGTIESAIYAGNILDAGDDSDKLADIVEFVRAKNGHNINTYTKLSL